MTRSVVVGLLLVAGICAVAVHTHPAAPKSAKTPDPESLPPDTFRKLAQALYQVPILPKVANICNYKYVVNNLLGSLVILNPN
jgi:hypothetical protein